MSREHYLTVNIDFDLLIKVRKVVDIKINSVPRFIIFLVLKSIPISTPFRKSLIYAHCVCVSNPTFCSLIIYSSNLVYNVLGALK